MSRGGALLLAPSAMLSLWAHWATASSIRTGPKSQEALSCVYRVASANCQRAAYLENGREHLRSHGSAIGGNASGRGQQRLARTARRTVTRSRCCPSSILDAVGKYPWAKQTICDILTCMPRHQR